MGFHHLRPGAKLVFHAEQIGLREFVFQLVHHIRVRHAIVIVGDDGLRLRAVEIVQVRLRHFLRTVGFDVLVHPRDREFSKDIDLRHHHFKALRFVLFTDVIHFRFEAYQHIAQPAFHEGGGRTATAGIEHFHVSQELSHKLLGFGFIAAVRFVGCPPGRQIGIARVTGGFWIREDQLHV
ncbi:hypothetical protein D3C72_1862560 [compost metagenome]